MRRKDKEIRDRRELEYILKNADFCRVGFADGVEPYIVPMVYGYDGDYIYLHSAKEGRKLDILRKNNLVCFEVELNAEIVRAEEPCRWDVSYSSVIATGRIYIVEDSEERKKGLNCIMQHYAAKKFDFSKEELDSVVVLRIDIEKMTGKKSKSFIKGGG